MFVSRGGVPRTRRRASSSAPVLTLALPHATFVVRVIGFAERRGSFAVAQQIYERLDGGSGDTPLAEAEGED
jgi:ribosome-associated heat shock protein Hsp15